MTAKKIGGRPGENKAEKEDSLSGPSRRGFLAWLLAGIGLFAARARRRGRAAEAPVSRKEASFYEPLNREERGDA